MQYSRRTSFIAWSAVRRSKKYVLPFGIALAFFLVLTFQYHPPLNQIIVIGENARELLGPMSRVNVYVPYSNNVSTKSTSLDNETEEFKDISPQPSLKKLINATKTMYPVTLNAPYLIENPNLCSSVKNLSVLVVVHTAPTHFERRLGIRRTWTNNSFLAELGTVRVLFLLGRVKDQKVQKQIEHEFTNFGDLLQGDFMDAYRNLTHKGVMAYKWMSERCKNAKFILKVDDDITVNMYKLFTEVLPKYKGKSKQIMCNHIHPGTMPIIRNKKSKWYVSENHFRQQKFYPRYCSGFLVLFTNDFMSALYRSASLTPFFWVDDVYLYGLVPSHVPGIHYNGLAKGSHQLNGKMAIKCYKNVTKTCDFLVTGAGEAIVMEEIWYNMGLLYLKNRDTVIKVDTTPTTTTTMSTTTNQEKEEEIKTAVIQASKKLKKPTQQLTLKKEQPQQQKHPHTAEKHPHTAEKHPHTAEKHPHTAEKGLKKT